MSDDKLTRKISQAEIDRVAIKLFLRIINEWGLTAQQGCMLAGVENPEILNLWDQQIAQNKPLKLAQNTLERLSLVVGIYGGIQEAFTDSAQWRVWIHKPNSRFHDMSALDWILLQGVSGLKDVRNYLEGQNSGAYL